MIAIGVLAYKLWPLDYGFGLYFATYLYSLAINSSLLTSFTNVPSIILMLNGIVCILIGIFGIFLKENRCMIYSYAGLTALFLLASFSLIAIYDGPNTVSFFLKLVHVKSLAHFKNNKELLHKCERGNKIAPLSHEYRAKRGTRAEGVQSKITL